MRWLSATLAVGLVVVLGTATWGAPGDKLWERHNPNPGAEFWRIGGACDNKVLVGAYKNSGGGTVYVLDGTTGNVIPPPIPNPNQTPGDRFGFGVGWSGANIVVGAYQPTYDSNAGPGVAYLFDGSPNYPRLNTFLNPTPQIGDEFGAKVAGVGGYVFVTAGFDHSDGNQGGAVYMFGASSPWNLVRTIPNPAIHAGDAFGQSIAGIGSTKVAIGAVYADPGGLTDAGLAYLHDIPNNTTQPLALPSPEPGELSGYSVGAVGSYVVVGAPKHKINGHAAGAVHIFDGSNGTYLRTILNPNPGSDADGYGDMFGIEVGAVGNNIVIGAHKADLGASDAGVVYLFDVNGNQLLTIPNPAPLTVTNFGSCVAGLGQDILASGGGPLSGGCVVYKFEGVPEPSTFVLLGVAAMSLLAYAWPWRRRAA